MSSSTAATQSAAPDYLATPRDWERIRFTVQTALYGATVGGCAILVNFLTRAQLPDAPQHLAFSASLYIGSVGAIFAAPIAYWMYGAPATFPFYAWRDRGPRGWMPWAGFGLGYALAYPLILGTALPLVVLFTLAWDRLITVPRLLIGVVDLAIRTPVFAITGGLHFIHRGPGGAVLCRRGAGHRRPQHRGGSGDSQVRHLGGSDRHVPGPGRTVGPRARGHAGQIWDDALAWERVVHVANVEASSSRRR